MVSLLATNTGPTLQVMLGYVMLGYLFEASTAESAFCQATDNWFAAATWYRTCQSCCAKEMHVVLMAEEAGGALTLSVLHPVPLAEHAVEDALTLRLQDVNEGCEGAQPLLSIQHGMYSAASHIHNTAWMRHMSPGTSPHWMLHVTSHTMLYTPACTCHA